MWIMNNKKDRSKMKFAGGLKLVAPWFRIMPSGESTNGEQVILFVVCFHCNFVCSTLFGGLCWSHCVAGIAHGLHLHTSIHYYCALIWSGGMHAPYPPGHGLKQVKCNHRSGAWIGQLHCKVNH